MKKVFLRIALIIVFPLIVIGGINYFIDPDYTLNKSYIPDIVSKLNGGKMISGPVNINMRRIKKQWIQQMDTNPEVLVLGSSRTLNLHIKESPGQQYFNASVSNCTFQDMYSFIECFDKKDKPFPKKVIICCDQWLFGDSFKEKRWLENRDEFIVMAEKARVLSFRKTPSKWSLQKEWINELFSVRYLIRSIQSKEKAMQIAVCNTIKPEKMMLLPDGTRRIPDRVSNITETQKAKLAKEYFNKSADEKFVNLSPYQKRLFESLVRFLRKKNCEIVLFIPPYHPDTYKRIEKSKLTKGILESDNYIRQFAAANSINLVGATNPLLLGFDSSNFYDAVHLKQEPLLFLFDNN